MAPNGRIRRFSAKAIAGLRRYRQRRMLLSAGSRSPIVRRGGASSPVVIVQPQAPTRRAKVANIVRRGSSRVRRFGKQKAQGFNWKRIAERKVKTIAGAGLSVALEIAAATTTNTVDDMLVSVPAQAAIGLVGEFLFGERAFGAISDGMLGASSGQWLRKRLAGLGTNTTTQTYTSQTASQKQGNR